MATRDQMRRYRARKRAAAAAEATGDLSADAIAKAYLDAVIAWAGKQTATTARGLALVAAGIADDLKSNGESESDAKLRALCEEEGVDGAVDRDDDVVRTVALSLVRDAHTALLAGPVTVSDVRAGMRACGVLAKRRPKLNRRAFDIWMARLISGVGNPPPADLTEEGEG